MPIDVSDVPPKAIEAIQRAIAERASSRTFATAKLRSADVNTLGHSMPHRVAYLSLTEIRRGTDLRSATQEAGWRFLIHGAAEAIASARIMQKEGEEFELGELTEGPFVSSTESAIRAAENLPEVRNGHFEAALLVAPDVHVSALWLKDKDALADIVIPLAPTNTALVANQPMTTSAFMETVKGLSKTLGSRR